MNIRNKLPDGHHSGAEIQREHLLKFYNVETLEEYRAYISKPIYKDFSHVPNDKSLKVIMVSEKNTISISLASRLGYPFQKMRYYEKHGLIPLEDAKEKDPKNELPFLKVYKFQCQLFDRKADAFMIATNGHLYTEDFAEPLRNPIDAFVHKIIEKPDNNDNGYLVNETKDENGENIQRQNHSKNFRDFAEKVARGSDALVLWLDNDNAGEKICYEVIDLLIGSLKAPPTKNKMDVVYRATFNVATKAQYALQNLGRPNFFKYSAMILKHYMDLIVGLSFSHQVITVLSKAFPHHEIKDIPFGPCQTTALTMCVNQHLQKEACHKFVIEITLNINGKTITAISNEFEDKQSAVDCCKKLQSSKCRVLVEPSHETVTISSPEGFNTFKALPYFSKDLQMSPYESAKNLQNLYERGIVTYIQTESTKYPDDMFEINRNSHCDMYYLLDRTIRYLNDKNKTNFNINDMDFEKAKSVGVDVGDHPPIMPSFARVKDKLNEKETEVYDIVCSWLIATFMKDYIYAKETTIFGIDDIKFVLSCYKEIEPGFTQLLKQFKVETTEEDFSQTFIQGAEFVVENIEIKRSPFSPELLNEHTLVEKMEEFRIGTDCSIPEHIFNMERTKLVKIDKKRREFEPTDLGLALIDSYKNCIDEFIQPSYRQKFVDHLEDVASERKDFVEVFDHYEQQTLKYLHLFMAKFNPAELDLSKFEKCFDLKPSPRQQRR